MTFNAEELRKILGITPNKYTNYTSRKLIIHKEYAGGRGTVATYTKEDVLRNYAFIELADYGLDHNTASKLAYNAIITSTSCFIKCTESISITIDFSGIIKALKPKTKLTRRKKNSEE